MSNYYWDVKRLERQLEVVKYNYAQASLFLDDESDTYGDREAPEGLGRYAKVWKASPNTADAYASYSGPLVVNYGWRWRCMHPDHVTKKGNIRRHEGHAMRGGFEGAVEALERHWRKYHVKL